MTHWDHQICSSKSLGQWHLNPVVSNLVGLVEKQVLPQNTLHLNLFAKVSEVAIFSSNACQVQPGLTTWQAGMDPLTHGFQRHCQKHMKCNEKGHLNNQHGPSTTCYITYPSQDNQCHRQEEQSPVELACCLGVGGGAGFFFLFSFSNAFLS